MTPCIDPLDCAIRTMPYKIRIGNRVLEYDPLTRLTREITRIPKQEDKGWYLADGHYHYGTTVDLKQSPHP